MRYAAEGLLVLGALIVLGALLLGGAQELLGAGRELGRDLRVAMLPFWLELALLGGAITLGGALSIVRQQA